MKQVFIDIMNTEFSVVIPVYNEEESLDELLLQLKSLLQKLSKPYEIIFIDDGSTDDTLEILKEFEKKEKEVKVYSFRKNLGKSYSLMLGFKKAIGKYIITLDADLQDDPENIPHMVESLKKENYDMITGWRKERHDKGSKVLSSKISNSVISSLFGIKIHDLNGGLKIYRAEAAKELRIYGGLHRFIPIIVDELGYNVGEIPVAHHSRKYGKSKYKFSKIFTDIPDLVTLYFLTKYTNRPLHFFGKIGIFVLFIGILMVSYFGYIHTVFNANVGRRPLFFISILLIIAGIQTIFTGLIADLIVNVQVDKHIKLPTKYESPK